MGDLQGFTAAMSGMGIIITIVSIVITIVVLLFVWRIVGGIMRGQKQTAQLLAQGEAAQARVLQLADTGMKINYNPVADVWLEVHRRNAVPYNVQTRVALNMMVLPRVQPGMVVNVKVDPMDPNKVALDLA